VTLNIFADVHVARAADVTTGGLASYNAKSLGARTHAALVQTTPGLHAERKVHDTLLGIHWAMSLLKRWLLGTHAGAVQPKHLQASLDELPFVTTAANQRRRSHRRTHAAAISHVRRNYHENSRQGNRALSRFPELSGWV
jgi:hypothetical protein